MRVLLLTSHLNAGGITQYLLTLSRGLLASGHQVWMVAQQGDAQDRFKALGVNVINCPLKVKSEVHMNLYLSLPKIMRLIKSESIEVIHAQTRVTQVLAAILSCLTKVPYVATCHGFFRARFFRRLIPCWGQKTIAISTPVVKHLTDDFNVRLDNIALIPNGIDVNKFNLVNSQDKQRLRRERGLEDGFYFGIIARLSSVKGIDILINSFNHVYQKNPKARLLIVGLGPDEDKLKNLVKDLGLEKSVYFQGIVQETAGMLLLMDVFVMPSRQEGLGLAVMEAMSAGLPVIVSRVGGLIDLIEDKKTGYFVESENSALLTKQMMDVMNDYQQALMVGLNARNYALKNFHYQDMIDKTVNLYMSVTR